VFSFVCPWHCACSPEAQSQRANAACQQKNIGKSLIECVEDIERISSLPKSVRPIKNQGERSI